MMLCVEKFPANFKIMIAAAVATDALFLVMFGLTSFILLFFFTIAGMSLAQPATYSNLYGKRDRPCNLSAFRLAFISRAARQI